ncbi:SDR family NAD(P)-dependent oxidoreductase [Pseudonocardia endophytica]|uniref:Ketoreductase domain-containing protein n=1 Tax=Pseudonocardia endophytica TaxID=401976 RepID=A0A4R1I1U6_PSEEN|nr:SDR family NAD(P)-dependent oxidoreductase [Pseudonocardia endophytica]TCK27555.1 hypothetical protein EV378_3427 [Pseudonocardia endophytica]
MTATPIAPARAPRPGLPSPRTATTAWSVVTGASSGIGAEFARELGRRGHHVLMAGRSRDGLGEVAADVAASETVAGDLTDPADLAALERSLAGRDVELLVANAGSGGLGVLSDLDVPTIDDTIAVNLTAVIRLCRAVLPGMLERGRGAIVLVSSSAAAQPAPGNPVYSATKAAVENFARSLRADVRSRGISVTCVRPGYIRTAFHARHNEDLRHVPERLWGTPHDVVEATLRAQRAGRAFVTVPAPRLASRLYAATAPLRRR